MAQVVVVCVGWREEWLRLVFSLVGFDVWGIEAGDGVRHAVTFRFEE
jgi:hypothetical protein